mgnify:CR=1 FL=1
MIIYRVITSEHGIKALEEKISQLINKGWKLSGGIAFNQGYPYQVVIGKKEDEQTSTPLGANEAMKKLDDLT